MKNSHHLQSKEGRLKAINRFCNITGVMAIVYIFVLYFIGLKFHASIMVLTAASFFLCSVLNSKSYFSLAKFLIVAFTNLAVFYYSVLLGFKIGVHLYLYTAPVIAYLLFDLAERKKIILVFSAYLLNYLLIFIIHRYELIRPISLPDKVGDLIYMINFSFSLILCFTLIFYFAFNNSIHSKMISAVNESLEEKQEELQKEVQEKNVLLSEIHHRVKNNLAVISGLVELQNFYVKDVKASAILKESSSRIKSIALLHEKLYESKNLDKIELRTYIDELIHFSKLTFNTNQKEIKILSTIENAELALEDALPFSLLLNELITNSYKHAFIGRETGVISISLIKRFDEMILNFKDNGNGFNFSLETREKTLGMSLIDAFSKQLKGKWDFISSEGNGTEFKLRFNR